MEIFSGEFFQANRRRRPRRRPNEIGFLFSPLPPLHTPAEPELLLFRGALRLCSR